MSAPIKPVRNQRAAETESTKKVATGKKRTLGERVSASYKKGAAAVKKQTKNAMRQPTTIREGIQRLLNDKSFK